MSERLILLQAYGNPQEAELVRGLLESHGIPVFLGDEHIARLGAYMPIGGVKLRVREEDLKDAQQILQETPAEEDSGDEDTTGDPACPICGGQRSEPVTDPVRLLLGVALLGIPFLLWPGKRRCEICGNVWRK